MRGKGIIALLGKNRWNILIYVNIRIVSLCVLFFKKARILKLSQRHCTEIFNIVPMGTNIPTDISVKTTKVPYSSCLFGGLPLKDYILKNKNKRNILPSETSKSSIIFISKNVCRSPQRLENKSGSGCNPILFWGMPIYPENKLELV